MRLSSNTNHTLQLFSISFHRFSENLYKSRPVRTLHPVRVRSSADKLALALRLREASATFRVALRGFVKLVSPAIIGYTCSPMWTWRNSWLRERGAPDSSCKRFLDYSCRFKVAVYVCKPGSLTKSGPRHGDSFETLIDFTAVTGILIERSFLSSEKFTCPTNEIFSISHEHKKCIASSIKNIPRYSKNSGTVHSRNSEGDALQIPASREIRWMKKSIDTLTKSVSTSRFATCKSNMHNFQ